MSKEPVHNTNIPSIGSTNGRDVFIIHDDGFGNKTVTNQKPRNALTKTKGSWEK